MSYKKDNEYVIGNAFDLAEEVRYELEELAMPELLKLAQSLPEPKRRELLRICRHHVGYATGLIRSGCGWLGQVVPPRECVQEGHRLRYKPLVEPPKTLPAEISKQVFHYEQHLLNAVKPGTRRRHGNLLWKFFDRFRNHKRVEEFLPADIASYREQRRSEGVKPAIIESEVSIVRAFFAWAMERDNRITCNPALRQEPNRGQQPAKSPAGIAA